ncbi:hypothetical protein ATKI12_4254 [Kitasatospora sp. Ki12]
MVTWRSAGDWSSASPARRTLAAWHWDGYYGERRNELVFIGGALDRQRLRRLLDAALLDDGELSLGQDGWRHLPDPILGHPGQDPHPGG